MDRVKKEEWNRVFLRSIFGWAGGLLCPESTMGLLGVRFLPSCVPNRLKLGHNGQQKGTVLKIYNDTNQVRGRYYGD